MLLRVDYSSIDYEGNFISIKDPDANIRKLAYEEPPKYSEAIYATTYYLTTNVEREMFKKKAIYSTDAPLKDVTDAIVGVEGYKSGLNEDEIVAYFIKKMPTSNPNNIGFLDLNYVV